jgi:hypothetical protein
LTVPAGGPIPERRFHPARLADNPHLDAAAYAANLAELPVVERERLLRGDWDIRPDGGVFRRAWFTIINPGDVPSGLELVRSWDLAATAARPDTDPDYTVGVIIGRDERPGIYHLLDIVRLRGTAPEVEQVGRATAARDGQRVKIIIEEAGGSVRHPSASRRATGTVRPSSPPGSRTTTMTTT